MELAEVERALRRPGAYFFEDGLWEVGAGLWIGLTVAVPQAIGGAVANWAPVVMLLTGVLGLRPAVRAAKRRWVYPRTGHVSYPGDETTQTRSSLGLGPATSPAVGSVPGSRTALVLAFLLGTAAAALMGAGFGVSGRLGFGDAGAHLTIGTVLGVCLLAAARRWGQRRWIPWPSS